jgi:hypothetical protein
MSNKRAFVRYTKAGKIVPGSLILTNGSYPSGPSTWKEVPMDLCCETVTFSTQVNDTEINNVSIRFFCNSSITNTTYSGENSTNGDSLALILNQEFGAEFGTFSYITDGTFILEMSPAKVKELCSDGYLSFEIFSD